jgi:maltose O-acetyltransferase
MTATADSRAWATWVNSLLASPSVTDLVRAKLLRKVGIALGEHSIVSPHCWIYGERLTIGQETFIGPGCYIENREPIRIGSRCALAMQVSIMTSTHAVGRRCQRAGPYIGRSVTIEDGCWIGARVVIMPGVTVRQSCIVGAGAIVTRDCAPDGVYAGVPARRQRALDAADRSAP